MGKPINLNLDNEFNTNKINDYAKKENIKLGGCESNTYS